MSIRRCPYCKAIIEEGAEFCSNCGTQLLFPEDEMVEEEIPGEKDLGDEENQEEFYISEEDEENEAEDEEEDLNPAGGEEFPGEKEAAAPEADGEGVKEEPGKSTAEQEDIPADELDGDKDQEEGGLEGIEKEDSVKLDEKDASFKDSADGKDSEEFGERKIFEEDERSGLDDSKPGPLLMAGDFDSVELEKQEIDKFIHSIKKDRGEEPEPLAPHMPDMLRPDEAESEPASVPDDSQEVEEPKSFPPVTPSEELFKKEDVRVSTDSLPPWASKIKDDLTPEILLTEEEREGLPGEEEERSQIQDDDVIDEPARVEKGIGFPEGLSQRDLPFAGADYEKKAGVRKKRPFPLAVWLKSRLFDISIIAAVWLAAVWIASSVMEVGFFRLIGASTLLLGIFYAILLAGYFFLFFFFLGETLGDYVFSEREKSKSRRPA